MDRVRRVRGVISSTSGVLTGVLSLAGGAVIPVSISGTPPAGIVSSAYSFTPTTANGSGTKSFALTGTLPTGLNFSTTTGAITGTPTTVQTSSGLNITVTDSSGSAALGTFSIAITAALSISGTPAAATIGSAYSFTPTAAGGSGTRTFSYSGTTLATYGLSFSTTTGAITGTVSGSPGTISGTITVTDSSGSANLPISVSVSAAVTFLQPYNRDFVQIGDSRTANSGSSNFASLGTTAASISDNSSGPLSWVAAMTQNRIKIAPFAFYGISAQTVQQILTVPRATTVTLGIDYLAMNQAANVLMFLGTNNAPGSLAIGVGGAARTMLTAAIDVLTNPSSTRWNELGASGPIPLYGGQAKNVWLINDMPRGVAPAGVTGTFPALTPTEMANFKAYCDYMLTLGGPRVVVIDTFNNPLILDASSGANLLNVAGTEVDGLHPGAVGAYELGTIIAPQITSLIDASVNFAPLPTSATTGNYINPNPLFSGTAGTKSGIVTGTVPNNTTVTCSGVTGMTVVASIEAMPNGEGNAVVLTVAGTASAAGAIIVSQTVPAASITMGTDKIRFVANAYYTIDPGSLFNAAGFVCFMTPSPSTYAQTISGLAVTSQTNN
jgi:hypothetical protein